MKVMITGGTGFLGSALAKRLQAMSYEVTIMGRDKEKGTQLEQEGIRFIQAEFTDQHAIVKAFEGMDYVFHCGALSSPWGKYEAFYEANVIGTENVIQACKQHQVKRLIHVSTPSIYFDTNERLEVKEDDVLPPVFLNHYAETKFLAELRVDQAYQEGLAVITIRPRAIFGPGDTAIIPRLIRANQERFVPLIHQGNAVIDLTYVDNVVDALILCMDSDEDTLGKKYNISNGERVVLKDVLARLFQELQIDFHYKHIPYRLAYSIAYLMEKKASLFRSKEEPMLTRYSVTVLSSSQTVNIDKAKQELHYQPKISIEEGIQLFSKWWLENDDGYRI